MVWSTCFYGDWTTRFDRFGMTFRPINAYAIHITNCRVMMGSGGIFSILAWGQRPPIAFVLRVARLWAVNIALSLPSTPAMVAGGGGQKETHKLGMVRISSSGISSNWQVSDDLFSPVSLSAQSCSTRDTGAKFIHDRTWFPRY